MSHIEKNAIKFAKEMIEHGYMVSMSPNEVVNVACDMAYKIHEKAKSYHKEEALTRKDVEKIASSVIKPQLTPHHHQM